MEVQVQTINAYSVLNPARGFISRYDATLNPYQGCAFACSYCYARFFPNMTQRQMEDWGSWVAVKQGAVQALLKDIKPGMKIYMSTATDPYQPVEKKAEVTRSLLEAMLPFQPRLTIQTRSPLVTRDISLLQQFQHVRVNMTINADSEAVLRRYERSTPSLTNRAKAIIKVKQAGIPIGVSISPMLPLQDVDRFAQWLRSLEASEYMALEMKPGKAGIVAAQSPEETLKQLQEDGWTHAHYQEAFDWIASFVSLKDGTAGFSPPGDE